MKIAYLLIAFILISCTACFQTEKREIDLSGEWTFAIDSLDQGIIEKWYEQDLTETVRLPASMVENGKGNPVGHNTKWVGNFKNKSWFEDENYKAYLDDEQFLFPYWLIPEKHYYGAAWYQKIIEIPESCNGSVFELYLERCHWETQVWLDDQKVGMRNSLGTAHRYDLTKFLTPGKHKLSICVDNRIKAIDVGPDSHSISDHTQSNWNGIVGEIKLIKKEQISIGNVQVFPDVKNKSAKLEIELKNSTELNVSGLIKIEANLINSDHEQAVSPIQVDFEINDFTKKLEVIFPMGEDVKLWDEFSPNLYQLQVQLKSKGGEDHKLVQFGMREFKPVGTRFEVNGRPIFLRGTLECAIFPKTGYPPTDVASWKRIIKVCQGHGLNHMRFHSWCPPEAAFFAADELGFYLQAECSSWANSTSSVGDGKPIDQWLYQESELMIREYGNHPSFCLFVYGNEPGGKNQSKYLGDFVSYWKAKDNRRVYSSGAGWPAIPENDFHNVPWPRIQGWGEQLKSIINAEPPRTNYDWRDKLGDNDRPIVSHEIGQWCVYPNLKEVEKYDGVLKATNFELFKRSLEAHQMSHLADSFLLASGKLQALCYKADIEAALRTPGFGGFQLLDLHDFPGQGTALVGVLDPFWEEKGYVSPEEFSRFCNETVPLARFDKRIFQSNEAIEISIEVAHFGVEELKATTPNWSIKDQNENVLKSGLLSGIDVPFGNTNIGLINTKIEVENPMQLTLEVSVAGFSNSWDIWVYPTNKKINDSEVIVTDKINNQLIQNLKGGAHILLSLGKGKVAKDMGGEVAVGFSSIFWNTAWTGGQKPHTLGVLVNPNHPAFNEFPTEYHSNWQWWDAMSHADAINLEKLDADIEPLIRVIDDWVSNRQLALAFEAKVGKGKLMVSGIDFHSNMENRTEARQLLFSLKKYMMSDDFNPISEIRIEQVKSLLR